MLSVLDDSKKCSWTGCPLDGGVRSTRLLFSLKQILSGSESLGSFSNASRQTLLTKEQRKVYLKRLRCLATYSFRFISIGLSVDITPGIHSSAKFKYQHENVLEGFPKCARQEKRSQLREKSTCLPSGAFWPH